MTFEEDIQKLDLKSIVLGSILGALGFLVALSWRDFIQHIIDSFIPKSESLFYQLFATIMTTLFAVFLGYILVRVSRKHITDMFRRRPYRIVGKVKVKSI